MGLIPDGSDNFLTNPKLKVHESATTQYSRLTTHQKHTTKLITITSDNFSKTTRNLLFIQNHDSSAPEKNHYWHKDFIVAA
jgi:UV DNA damage repair endonuclease